MKRLCVLLSSLCLAAACGPASDLSTFADEATPRGPSLDEAAPEEEPSVEPAASALSGDAAARAREPVAVTRLRDASAGLLFLSESDYPFVVRWWRKPGGRPTAAAVAALAGEAPDAPVELRKLDDFFRAATTALPEHGPDEAATVERYRKLVALIKKELTYVSVFRFGQIEIHAHVVGMLRNGDWVALSTTQIET